MKYEYVYVLDTLADWELGHLIAELNSGQYFKRRGERISVKTVGLTKDPVTTMELQKAGRNTAKFGFQLRASNHLGIYSKKAL